jgi:hypothetical protein
MPRNGSAKFRRSFRVVVAGKLPLQLPAAKTLLALVLRFKRFKPN